MTTNIDRIRDALAYLDPGMPREEWVKIGMSVKAALGEEGFETFDTWSQSDDSSYSARDVRDTWKSVNGSGGVTEGTLYYQARLLGWRDNGTGQKPTPEEVEARRRQAAKKEAEKARKHTRAASKAAQIWKAARPAPTDHPYLVRKQIQAHGARVWSGRLVIPLRSNLVISSLQFIAGDGTKRFLPGGRVQGCYFSIGCLNGTICICEGFASGATIRQATGHAVAVAFSAGNLKSVALALRMKFTKAKIILCADNDRFTVGNPGATKAREAALAVHGYLVVPRFDDIGPYDYWPQGGEANG